MCLTETTVHHCPKLNAWCAELFTIGGPAGPERLYLTDWHPTEELALLELHCWQELGNVVDDLPAEPWRFEPLPAA